MGGEGGKSESSSNARSNFSQDVWSGQSPALQQLYSNAGNLFQDIYSNQMNMIPGQVDVQNQITSSAIPAFQRQLSGGATSDMGLKQLLADSLRTSTSNPSNLSSIYANIMGGEGNNYADAMKSRMTADASRAGKNMMSVADARAVGAGQSGSSRHGVLQSQGWKDINDQLQRGLFDVGYNTFDKDLSNKLNIAKLADSNIMNRENLMADLLRGQDETTNAGINSGPILQNLGMGSFAPTMVPWQSMGQYANILGRPTILGSGSSSANSDSKAMSGGGGFGWG